MEHSDQNRYEFLQLPYFSAGSALFYTFDIHLLPSKAGSAEPCPILGRFVHPGFIFGVSLCLLKLNGVKMTSHLGAGFALPPLNEEIFYIYFAFKVEAKAADRVEVTKYIYLKIHLRFF